MKAKAEVEKDHLWDALEANYEALCSARAPFAAKDPVLLFDIQEQRIYVYPYADFLADLNTAGQASLKTQYARAKKKDAVVVFMRDNVRKLLRSYTINM